MIIIYHNGVDVVEMANANASAMNIVKDKSIASALVSVAKEYPEELLVWCYQNLKEQLNVLAIENLFHHKKLLLTYSPTANPFINDNIGYVDTSLFIKINKEVTFPTWQMSSAVGGVNSVVLLAIKNEIPLDKNFDYFLCSLAKLAMSKGLLCYSEPNLLKEKSEIIGSKTSDFTLFRFVKQHYRVHWVFLLLLNLVIYERKFSILPFLFSFFYKNRSKASINLDAIKVQSSKKVVNQATIDVIIPTIGRKDYLFEVLKDFSNQTLLPTTIIIVEQNPDLESKTELDYLTDEEWPFTIKHTFTHQAGACNARNLALKQTQSEWVFLADDDIKFDNNFIQETFENIKKYGLKAASICCLQKTEKQIYETIFQWGSFGSGCSIVFTDSLKNCKFNGGYEFGYGEDGDFGMKLRNQGCDILYLPEPEILHLKAPIGGFRTKPLLQWQKDAILPKPSPTIMLYQLLHTTPAQTKSYKTTLFFKYYRLQKIKNPIRYYKHFQKQWERSVFWANELIKQNEI